MTSEAAACSRAQSASSKSPQRANGHTSARYNVSDKMSAVQWESKIWPNGQRAAVAKQGHVHVQVGCTQDLQTHGLVTLQLPMPLVFAWSIRNLARGTAAPLLLRHWCLAIASNSSRSRLPGGSHEGPSEASFLSSLAM